MKKFVSVILCIVMVFFCGAAGLNAFAGESVSTVLERDSNNAYLPFGWIYRARTDDFITEKLTQIKGFGITAAYFSIGAYTLDGETLTDGVEERMQQGIWENVGHWICLARQQGIDIIPIIDCNVNDAFLEYGSSVIEALKAAVADIVRDGFVYNGRSYVPSGIHFDCEPFRKAYQPFYLSALEALRDALPTGMTLSSATPANNGAWSDEYLATAAQYLDMVNPMLYDSNGPSDWGTLRDGVTQTTAEYISLVESTCLWYSRVISENGLDCDISPTVPSYADASTTTSGEGWPDASSNIIWYHLNYNSATGETLETVENCIAGVESAVAQGAAVTKLGIWNYYYFCGDDGEYQTSVNPYYDPDADQTAWLSWINKSVSGRLVQSELSYDETLDGLTNPERGFYRPVVLYLSKDASTAKDPIGNLIHLRVGLSCLSPKKNDGAEPLLTENMLSAIAETLNNLRTRGSTAVVRFAYDNYYGNANMEPSMDTIVSHIEQLKPIFYEYSDVIASVEAGFIGPWGEMHTSTMAKPANFNALTDALLNAVPYGVGITLRRPKFYADRFGVTLADIDKHISSPGTDEYRVGVFNDGYLGSSSDLGTFSNRAKETYWLSSQAKHTLYGGEAVLSGGVRDYNCIDFISQEMFVTHTSYLNSQWNDTLIGYWKNDEVYNGTDELYNSQSAYTYINNHLGYRYVLKSAEITPEVGQKGVFIARLAVENVGSANMVKQKKAQLIFVGEGGTYCVDINTDVRTWDSRVTSNECVAVNLPAGLTDGECRVYLRLSTFGTTRSAVRFANADIYDETLCANYIGTLTVGEVEEPTTATTTETTTETTIETTTEMTTEATTETTTEPVTEPSTQPESSEECDCICHSDGFMGFIYKIVRFFWKLFGTNNSCECGIAHY